MEPDNVIVFDGVCKLCNSYVNFIIKQDPEAHFRFTASQSAAGGQILRRHELDPAKVGTLVLLKGGRVYARSDAVLEIARHLRGPWRALRFLIVLPRWLRGRLYGILARNRYRWFGKLSACAIPGPEIRARFLGDTPVVTPVAAGVIDEAIRRPAG